MQSKTKPTLFSVVFEDNSFFAGGESYFDTKWNSIPEQSIKRIFYRLPGGDYLTLSGYDQYYHMIEATKDWMRMNRIKKTAQRLNKHPKLEYAYIMGKKDDKVTIYKISLGGHSLPGQISKFTVNADNKMIKKLNPSGWKKGGRN